MSSEKDPRQPASASHHSHAGPFFNMSELSPQGYSFQGDIAGVQPLHPGMFQPGAPPLGLPSSGAPPLNLPSAEVPPLGLPSSEAPPLGLLPSGASPLGLPSSGAPFLGMSPGRTAPFSTGPANSIPPIAGPTSWTPSFIPGQHSGYPPVSAPTSHAITPHTFMPSTTQPLNVPFPQPVGSASSVQGMTHDMMSLGHTGDFSSGPTGSFETSVANSFSSPSSGISTLSNLYAGSVSSAESDPHSQYHQQINHHNSPQLNQLSPAGPYHHQTTPNQHGPEQQLYSNQSIDHHPPASDISLNSLTASLSVVPSSGVSNYPSVEPHPNISATNVLASIEGAPHHQFHSDDSSYVPYPSGTDQSGASHYQGLAFPGSEVSSLLPMMQQSLLPMMHHEQVLVTDSVSEPSVMSGDALSGAEGSRSIPDITRQISLSSAPPPTSLSNVHHLVESSPPSSAGMLRHGVPDLAPLGVGAVGGESDHLPDGISIEVNQDMENASGSQKVSAGQRPGVGEGVSKELPPRDIMLLTGQLDKLDLGGGSDSETAHSTICSGPAQGYSSEGVSSQGVPDLTQSTHSGRVNDSCDPPQSDYSDISSTQRRPSAQPDILGGPVPTGPPDVAPNVAAASGRSDGSQNVVAHTPDIAVRATVTLPANDSDMKPDILSPRTLGNPLDTATFHENSGRFGVPSPESVGVSQQYSAGSASSHQPVSMETSGHATSAFRPLDGPHSHSSNTPQPSVAYQAHYPTPTSQVVQPAASRESTFHSAGPGLALDTSTQANAAAVPTPDHNTTQPLTDRGVPESQQWGESSSRNIPRTTSPPDAYKPTTDRQDPHNTVRRESRGDMKSHEANESHGENNPRGLRNHERGFDGIQNEEDKVDRSDDDPFFDQSKRADGEGQQRDERDTLDRNGRPQFAGRNSDSGWRDEDARYRSERDAGRRENEWEVSSRRGGGRDDWDTSSRSGRDMQRDHDNHRDYGDRPLGDYGDRQGYGRRRDNDGRRGYRDRQDFDDDRKYADNYYNDRHSFDRKADNRDFNDRRGERDRNDSRKGYDDADSSRHYSERGSRHGYGGEEQAYSSDVGRSGRHEIKRNEQEERHNEQRYYGSGGPDRGTHSQMGSRRGPGKAMSQVGAENSPRDREGDYRGGERREWDGRGHPEMSQHPAVGYSTNWSADPRLAHQQYSQYYQEQAAAAAAAQGYYANYQAYGSSIDQSFDKGYYKEMEQYGIFPGSQELPTSYLATDEYLASDEYRRYYEQQMDRLSQYSSSRSHTPAVGPGAMDQESYSGGQGAQDASSSLSAYRPSSAAEAAYYGSGLGELPADPQEEPVAPGRVTPHRFVVAHACATFDRSGRLIRILPHDPKEGRPATVLIEEDPCHSLHPDMDIIKAFPGPLVKGRTHKKDVADYCSRMARTAGTYQPGHPDAHARVLLWKFLQLLVKQNGTYDGSDVADLLLEGQDHLLTSYNKESTPPPPSESVHYERPAGGEETGESLDAGDGEVGGTSDSLSVTSSQQQQGVGRDRDGAAVMSRYRSLVLYGHTKEAALEWAMSQGLWGHALFLASRVDTKTHTRVMTRFAATAMKRNDPLQTIYQLMSHRLPPAVTSVEEGDWGDWRPHLAVMLSNSADPQLTHKSIVTLGDTLASRSLFHASQFCYLMAGCPFEEWARRGSAKLCLLGSPQGLPFNQFFSLQSVQTTEIFEYALSLGYPAFSLPALQLFKFMYAWRLIEAGQPLQALMYTEAIATVVLANTDGYSLTFLKQVLELGSCLQFLDPEQVNATDGHLISLPWVLHLQQAVLTAEDGGTAGGTTFQFHPEQEQNTDFSTALHQGSEQMGEPGNVPPTVAYPPQASAAPPPTNTHMDQGQYHQDQGQLQQPVYSGQEESGSVGPHLDHMGYGQEAEELSRQDQGTMSLQHHTGQAAKGTFRIGDNYTGSDSSSSIEEDDDSVVDSSLDSSGQDASDTAMATKSTFDFYANSVPPPTSGSEPLHQSYLPPTGMGNYAAPPAPVHTLQPYQPAALPVAAAAAAAVTTDVTTANSAASISTHTAESTSTGIDNTTAASKGGQSQGGGILGKFYKLFNKSQVPEAKLPDDKNPSLVFENGKWVDKNNPDDASAAPPPPPPTATPTLPGGMPRTASYSLKDRSGRNKYVDYIGQQSSSRSSPSSVPSQLFSVGGTGTPSASAIFNPLGANTPMQQSVPVGGSAPSLQDHSLPGSTVPLDASLQPTEYAQPLQEQPYQSQPQQSAPPGPPMKHSGVANLQASDNAASPGTVAPQMAAPPMAAPPKAAPPMAVPSGTGAPPMAAPMLFNPQSLNQVHGKPPGKSRLRRY